ncbi:DUF6182 family protein [Actinoplanes sp. TFC3]|uniref:DUF6182 family protein n=1 Tax=Actinoplanes sp. TFC3 TaxID=1710355 RepID=UPI000831BCF5|nr:DUF6182 family protein [Actinoplanes sp. TFC3]
MTDFQELLVAGALARVEAVGDQAGGGFGASVVVEDYTPQQLVPGVVAFVQALSEPDAGTWTRAFTRTAFLAGNPSSLAGRFPSALRSADGKLAWYGPGPDGERRTMSRMLRTFEGPGPVPWCGAPPIVVRLPGAATGVQVRAEIATDGVSAAAYLVHVHHAFAEAALRGLVGPGDTVRIEHHGELAGRRHHALLDPMVAHGVQPRISQDTRDPSRLRLYAMLTSKCRRGHPC